MTILYAILAYAGFVTLVCLFLKSAMNSGYEPPVKEDNN